MLKGVSEEQAEYRSDPAEWSIKDVLAHLIATEREIHAWIARRVEGQEADFALAREPAGAHPGDHLHLSAVGQPGGGAEAQPGGDGGDGF